MSEKEPREPDSKNAEPDSSMTDAEREMLQALEKNGGAPPTETAPEEAAPSGLPEEAAKTETPPVAAHPVDMEPVKERAPAAPDTDGNLKLILDIPVEIKVEVGNSRLSIREVLNLAPGAIVELDRMAGSPADLIVNGTPVGQGDVVVVDESYGIRITKLVDPEERISSL